MTDLTRREAEVLLYPTRDYPRRALGVLENLDIVKESSDDRRG
jgi:hypothetical protein